MNSLMKTKVAVSIIILFGIIGCSKASYKPAQTDQATLGQLSRNEVTSSSTSSDYKVTSNKGLLNAISESKPGDKIVMANGVWNNIQMKFTTSGTEAEPITLEAEKAGQVLIQGESDLQIAADYITISGLLFTNGYSPSRAVINFSIDDKVANHCTVTNCVIRDYNKPQRNLRDLWILIKGRHNQVDHCYLSGKANRGPTLRVDLEGNPSINNHHKIIHNHFGPRPPKGGPSAETIQIGNSHTSMCPSYTLVADNFFEECNGEVEVISSKTNFNEFRNNVFYKSEGSLVTRHGNYCTVDGNYFIGDGSNKIGGLRLIGTGHTVTNNYFYNLRGENFRSPLAVMNGIPKSPLNRYIQVTDVTVAHNSWVNCTAPLQFGVGSNIAQKDVLPASEIRSARPKRCIVANNLIHNTLGDKTPIVAHDKLDGIRFESNVINNQGVAFENVVGMNPVNFEMKKIAEYIYAPSYGFPDTEIFVGFGFDNFNKDLLGASRDDNNAIGAITGKPSSAAGILDRSKYGPAWYKTTSTVVAPEVYKLKPGDNISKYIDQVKDGDFLVLSEGAYALSSPLQINKTLTIHAAEGEKVLIKYAGPVETPLFEMNPKGKLTLSGITLQGTGNQFAIATLKENMSSLYNLTVENCTVENFDYILKAYKFSFSEHLMFLGSTFSNCSNGIELSAETDDRGDYNAENILITDCSFDNIESNVVDYYRGGYDESTVGGTLKLTNSRFTKCGAQEENGILINTYGIINVDISGNTFKNNKVKQVAQLWGAQNNKHSDNTIVNSGKIVVEENLKLKTFY